MKCKYANCIRISIYILSQAKKTYKYANYMRITHIYCHMQERHANMQIIQELPIYIVTYENDMQICKLSKNYQYILSHTIMTCKYANYIRITHMYCHIQERHANMQII